MFLTLVTTNITVITIVGHKNLTNVSTKKTQFLLKRRQEEDYQLVLLPDFSLLLLGV
jgi:hypothetical protein